uniref:RIKEN cDNA 4930447C04 gene n=1 Tax=Mus spicilegus TaxID=10103 RepID=A0A8C6I1J0_MUSSI
MKKEAPIPACLPLTISSCIGSKPGTEGTEPQICSRVSNMNDNLFVSLDRLLLEFVFQYEQDISIKEDTIQRINTGSQHVMFFVNMKII